MGKAFSCKGIALALDFFHLRGHRALAFLPESYLDFERIGALKYARTHAFLFFVCLILKSGERENLVCVSALDVMCVSI